MLNDYYISFAACARFFRTEKETFFALIFIGKFYELSINKYMIYFFLPSKHASDDLWQSPT